MLLLKKEKVSFKVLDGATEKRIQEAVMDNAELFEHPSIKSARNTDRVEKTFDDSREVPVTTLLVEDSNELQKSTLEDSADNAIVEEMCETVPISESAQETRDVNEIEVENAESVLDNAELFVHSSINGAQITDRVNETVDESRGVPVTKLVVEDSEDLEKSAIEDVGEDAKVEDSGDKALKSETAHDSTGGNDVVVEDANSLMDNSDSLGQPSIQAEHRKSNSWWQKLAPWSSHEDRGETVVDSVERHNSPKGNCFY